MKILEVRRREPLRRSAAVEAQFEAWLRSRPASVQQLAREFPAGLEILTDEGPLYLLGWTGDDLLIVTPIEPYAADAAQHERARAAQRYIHARHLREL